MGLDQPYYPIDPRGLQGPHSLSSRTSLKISKKVKIGFSGKTGGKKLDKALHISGTKLGEKSNIALQKQFQTHNQLNYILKAIKTLFITSVFLCQIFSDLFSSEFIHYLGRNMVGSIRFSEFPSCFLALYIQDYDFNCSK